MTVEEAWELAKHAQLDEDSPERKLHRLLEVAREILLQQLGKGPELNG